MRLWKRNQEYWVACSCGNLVPSKTKDDLSVLPCLQCRSKLPPSGEEIKQAVLETPPKPESKKEVPKVEPKPDPCLHLRCNIEEQSVKRIFCKECKTTVGYCE